jgi:hypothetical protein
VVPFVVPLVDNAWRDWLPDTRIRWPVLATVLLILLVVGRAAWVSRGQPEGPVRVVSVPACYLLASLPGLLALLYPGALADAAFPPERKDLVEGPNLWSRGDLVPPSIAFGIWVALLIGLVSIAVYVNRRPPGDVPAQAMSQREAILGGFVIAAVITVLFLLADMRGADLAASAKEGDWLRQSDSLLLVTAQPICITSRALGTASAGPYMYLGTSDGMMVLWELADPASDTSARLVRLPGDGVHMEQHDQDLQDLEKRSEVRQQCSRYASHQGVMDSSGP